MVIAFQLRPSLIDRECARLVGYGTTAPHSHVLSTNLQGKIVSFIEYAQACTLADEDISILTFVAQCALTILVLTTYSDLSIDSNVSQLIVLVLGLSLS